MISKVMSAYSPKFSGRDKPTNPFLKAYQDPRHREPAFLQVDTFDSIGRRINQHYEVVHIFNVEGHQGNPVPTQIGPADYRLYVPLGIPLEERHDKVDLVDFTTEDKKARAMLYGFYSYRNKAGEIVYGNANIVTSNNKPYEYTLDDRLREIPYAPEKNGYKKYELKIISLKALAARLSQPGDKKKPSLPLEETAHDRLADQQQVEMLKVELDHRKPSEDHPLYGALSRLCQSMAIKLSSVTEVSPWVSYLCDDSPNRESLSEMTKHPVFQSNQAVLRSIRDVLKGMPVYDRRCFVLKEVFGQKTKAVISATRTGAINIDLAINRARRHIVRELLEYYLHPDHGRLPPGFEEYDPFNSTHEVT